MKNNLYEFGKNSNIEKGAKILNSYKEGDQILKAVQTSLEKAEGSRGGKVIGHTRNGHAIYADKKAGHAKHEGEITHDYKDGRYAVKNDKDFIADYHESKLSSKEINKADNEVKDAKVDETGTEDITDRSLKPNEETKASLKKAYDILGIEDSIEKGGPGSGKHQIGERHFSIGYNNKKDTGHHHNIVEAKDEETGETFTHHKDPDTGKEGHEYYKGENYGGKGKSYSRNYEHGKFPEKHGDIYRNLEKLHHDKYGNKENKEKKGDS